MMNAGQIRTFLLGNPKPVRLRVTCADDEVHDIEVPRNLSWKKFAESIAALRPDLIEAFDGDDKLIRAVRPNEVEADEGGSSSTSASAASASAASAGAASAGAKFDPVVAVLDRFGVLLAEAYRHSTETAFARMVDLFTAVNRRSESLEKSLEATHKLLRRAWADELEAQTAAAEATAAASGDPLNQIVGAFVQGAAASAAAAVPKPNGAHNGAPNGKG